MIRIAPLVLVMLASLSAHCLFAEFATAAKPNVVLILVDDLGYGDLGCYGATRVQTPHIDRLASEGRRFTDAHSASAVCTPSRYGLLMGEYPFRRDLWGPVMNPSPLVVDPEQTSLADLFQRHGYATALFGKWHLGFGDQPKPDWNQALRPGPLELGFDHYFGIPVVNSHPPFVWVEDDHVVGLEAGDPLVYGGKPPTESYPEKMMSPAMSGAQAAHALYRDDQAGKTLVDRATRFIHHQQGSPFFLYLATPQIHHPFTPAREFIGTSRAGRYGDFIHELDWMVGQVVQTLEDAQVLDRTLIILTSDNGGMLNQGGQEAWREGHRLNGSLLGFKFDAWEGGHRVPMIARWPGKIPAGTVSDELICQVDLWATCAAMVGHRRQPGEAPDSIDMLPVFTGSNATPLREELVISPSKKSHLALRQRGWMYIGARGGGGFSGQKPGDHSLGGPAALQFAGQKNSDILDGQYTADAPQEQLYDLIADPFQTSNVIRQHPEIAARLRTRLQELRRQTPSSAARQ
jgi:arylsulfatase A